MARIPEPRSIAPELEYRNGSLSLGGAELEELAERFGTPLYVYSADHIRRRMASFAKGAEGRRTLFCYAVKACSNLSILRMMAAAGWGADIVSGGELYRALQAGVPAERIVFSGVGKSDCELHEALQAGIHVFSVESEAELERLSALAEATGRIAPLSLRVNPDVDPATHPYISTGLKSNKFGVPHGEARRLFAKARELPGLAPRGIGFHIGSQLQKLNGFRDAARVLRELIEAVSADGVRLEYLDVGGGLAIRYAGSDGTDDASGPPEPEEYVRLLLDELPYPELTIVFEPGRSVVGNAGVLLTRTLYCKQNEDRRFAIVDAAMNDLIRPALYQAEHEVFACDEARQRGGRLRTDLVGPVCESGDFFLREALLPDFQRGDLVCLASAGAYAFSMASNYNSRPRPAEVLIEDGQARLIRERESYADLVRGESPTGA